MTPRQDRTAGRKHIPPENENTPRLRLKPKAPTTGTTGYVDGAWWPHTNDLATELPDLLAVLPVGLGTIDRVVFNLAEWAKVPKKLVIDGRVVRLAGHDGQPVNTIEVIGQERNKIVLLVVPPHTEPDHAHATIMAAAAPDNASTVDGLLMISARALGIRRWSAAITRRRRQWREQLTARFAHCR
ncbi:MAG: DUF5994 family protein [Candidatus Sericytochromatia bacterium]